MPNRGPRTAPLAGRSLRWSLVPSLVLLALGCNDLIPPEPVPTAGYTMSLSAPALTIQAGTSSPTTTVTLVRTNFTAPVTLAVDIGDGHGTMPPGVTAEFAPSTTIGNSSVLTLAVGAAAVPGVYGLYVYGFVWEQRNDAGSLVEAPLTLTVTAPEPAPFTLTLSSPTLTIVQGAAATTTVNVVPNTFTGPVTLYVGWLHEDHDILPSGVTAAFAPNPATGNSSVLTLAVGAAAAPGVYDLFVSADATTGHWGYAPLTLTVSATAGPAPFTLTLSSPALTIVQGAAATTTVNVVPNTFTGPVTLYVGWLYEDHDILPSGVTAAFAPNPATGNNSVLTLAVGAAAAPGVYDLFVSADATTGHWGYAPLTLTVTAAVGQGTPVAQWGIGATASTEYTTGDWSASQATGVPNVTGYADDPSDDPGRFRGRPALPPRSNLLVRPCVGV